MFILYVKDCRIRLVVSASKKDFVKVWKISQIFHSSVCMSLFPAYNIYKSEREKKNCIGVVDATKNASLRQREKTKIFH